MHKLIKCGDCRKEISKSAAACPVITAPMASNRHNQPLFKFVLLHFYNSIGSTSNRSGAYNLMASVTVAAAICTRRPRLKPSS